MSNSNSTPKSVVHRSAVSRQKIGDRVNTIDAVCAAGASSPAVGGSPVASAALADLKVANDETRQALVSRNSLLVAYRAQSKVVRAKTAKLERATSTYMTSVDNLADGDAAVITKAGLPAREESVPVTVLLPPTKLRGEPGKLSKEAVVKWNLAPGASAYKVRVNFTPADPATWQELKSGSSRRRTITAPTPAAQFLVSVASIGGEDNSDWSDPILVTAR